MYIVESPILIFFMDMGLEKQIILIVLILAIAIFSLSKFIAKVRKTAIQKALNETQEEAQTILNKAHLEAHTIIKSAIEEMDKLDHQIEDRAKHLEYLKKAITEEEKQSHPYLAKLYADFNYIFDKNTAKHLRNKNRPAKKASETVSNIAREKNVLTKTLKQLEYQLNFYETLFPWLEEFREIPIEQAIRATSNVKDDYDGLKNWLSPEEYQKLSEDERSQLALDRWKKSKKTNWQIGIEYERYIGYLKELDGYKITYHGAIEGLKDMGRDLIAYKGEDIEIIQCKRWSKNKLIHEKHIFQLYGTMILEKIDNPTKNISGSLISTNPLSEKAQKCAEILGIRTCIVPMDNYPQIKCNVSMQTGEKIYHLPFDQQYDTIIIKEDRGECYVSTVNEARTKGFRRAYRWRGNI